MPPLEKLRHVFRLKPKMVIPRVLASFFIWGSSGCFLVDGLEGDTDGGGTFSPPLEEFSRRAYIAQLEEFTSNEVPEDCRQDNDINRDGLILANLLLQEAGDLEWPLVDVRVDPYVDELADLPQFEVGDFAEDAYLFQDGVGLALDTARADASDFSFYAGHGFPGKIAMNTLVDGPESGCSLRMQENIRLGRYCGGRSKVAVYSASCVLGVNSQICPLPQTESDATMWGPWPDVCWQPLQCTSLRSLDHHTLGFVDSPSVDDEAQANWYRAMRDHGRNVTRAWIMQNNVDPSTGKANQPASLIQDDVSLTTRFGANLAHGTNMNGNTGDPDNRLYGFIYVSTSGETGITDGEGNPLQYGSQAPEEDYCVFGHAQACAPNLEYSDKFQCD